MINAKAPGNDGTDDLAETKRIMERLVRTPAKGDGDTAKKGGKPAANPERKRRSER